jgi:hypothetical protein
VLARAEADDVAPRRFQLACFIRHRDGRGRLHTVERSGQERHYRLRIFELKDARSAPAIFKAVTLQRQAKTSDFTDSLSFNAASD